MNADALSDAVLATVSLIAATRLMYRQPGLGTACMLIGLAAAIGVLRYSGVESALGPHRFFSLLAACAAFPLLTIAVRWPDDPVARYPRATARFVVLIGGVGIALVLAGFERWREIVPAVAAALLLLTVFKTLHRQRIAGVLLIAAALAFAAAGQPVPILDLGPAELLHYTLAAGLLLLALAPPPTASA